MKDQTRNLNPTPEARVAMIIYGRAYSEQSGGSMDFWDRLDPHNQKICKLVAEEVKRQALQSLLEKIPKEKEESINNPSNGKSNHSFRLGFNKAIKDVHAVIKAILEEGIES